MGDVEKVGKDIGGWFEEEVIEPVKEWGEELGDKATDWYHDFSGQTAAEEGQQLIEQQTIAGIKTLETQQQQIEEMYGDYYEYGLEGLGKLSSMVLGEDYEYTPSKLFEYKTERGERALRRQRAARGLLGTTGTEIQTADLYQQAASEDVENQYLKTLQQVQIGAGAGSKISSGTTGMAGGIGGLYQSQQAQQQQLTQMYGGAQSALYQTGANTLMNLGMYMGGK